LYAEAMAERPGGVVRRDHSIQDNEAVPRKPSRIRWPGLSGPTRPRCPGVLSPTPPLLLILRASRKNRRSNPGGALRRRQALVLRGDVQPDHRTLRGLSSRQPRHCELLALPRRRAGRVAQSPELRTTGTSALNLPAG